MKLPQTPSAKALVGRSLEERKLRRLPVQGARIRGDGGRRCGIGFSQSPAGNARRG
jgi:hypothetical protein